MPTVRINGVKLDLSKLSDAALDALLSTIHARYRRVERDAALVGEEMGRRAVEGPQPALPLALAS